MTKCRLLLGFLLLAGSLGAQAGGRPTPHRRPAPETGHETAAPSLSRHMREAHRISLLLDDALLLSTAQRYAVARCTATQRRALVLAATAADVAQAQAQHLQMLRKTLTLSQLNAYAALGQQLAGTTLPLDGPELAQR